MIAIHQAVQRCRRCHRPRSPKASSHPWCIRCHGDNQREWQREGSPGRFLDWLRTTGAHEHMRKVGRLRRGLWRAQLLSQASGVIALDDDTEDLLRERLGLPVVEVNPELLALVKVEASRRRLNFAPAFRPHPAIRRRQ